VTRYIFLGRDMDRLHDGFGDKMATFIQWIATFIGGYTIGFAVGWKLTLVVIAVSPLLIITAAVFGRVSLQHYSVVYRVQIHGRNLQNIILYMYDRWISGYSLVARALGPGS